MHEYNICNQADEELFHKQCRAIEGHIPDLLADEPLRDVDGTLVQKYTHAKGTIKVKNDVQTDALFVVADFDLLPYFKK